MGINILVISDNEIKENEIGVIEERDIKFFQENKDRFNLKCLPYLDPYGDTIFNQKQIKQIVLEINTLEKIASINYNALFLIKKAVDIAMQNNCYLLFIGD